jgi:hypothetical protein
VACDATNESADRVVERTVGSDLEPMLAPERLLGAEQQVAAEFHGRYPTPPAEVADTRLCDVAVTTTRRQGPIITVARGVHLNVGADATQPYHPVPYRVPLTYCQT